MGKGKGGEGQRKKECNIFLSLSNFRYNFTSFFQGEPFCFSITILYLFLLFFSFSSLAMPQKPLPEKVSDFEMMPKTHHDLTLTKLQGLFGVEFFVSGKTGKSSWYLISFSLANRHH